MRLDVSQHLRLEQRMKLSPRIIQAMEILQLPLMALQERIEQELISNPCLEIGDGPAEDAPPAPREETGPDRGDEAMVVTDDDSHRRDFERLAEFTAAYGEEMDWADRPYRKPAVRAEGWDPKMDALANTPAHEQTLMDYLLEQWAFVEVAEPVARAGRAIIANIDDSGYLRVDLGELVDLPADEDGDGPLSPEALRAALERVQKLEPPGVGARDLRECLLIQLDAEAAAGREVTLPRLLVSDHLREIELNHIPQIAKRTDRTVEQINEAIEFLGRLDPHPGKLIGSRPVPYILPDALVELDEDGNVVVAMQGRDGGGLRLSSLYRKMSRGGKIDAEAKEFIRRNLRNAQWLIGAIGQRKQTLRRVVEEVFQAQKDFLERGKEALRPLPMTDVARKVGVHVATVSRAVAGKYVQTPRGIVPLRMFFSGGKTTDEGRDMAWDAIKVRLQEVVDREDKAKPLADDQIAEALRAEGIEIARRTVAKYRNLLEIPSARQRRKF